jgi:acetyl-CoA carboxylase biotin carboxyl carrier protein
MSDNTASAKAEEKMKTARRKSGVGKQNQSSKASLNMAEIRELAELVNEHGFTDFEFENANIRVRLSKMAVAPIIQSVAPVSAPIQATAPQAVTVGNVETPAETSAKADENLHQITSPIVGTFYRSPSPDKPPYVSEGDTVNESTVVCIVEAMKLMNEIQAEFTGEVVKIYVENGQPVEFGQPLFGIKK